MGLISRVLYLVLVLINNVLLKFDCICVLLQRYLLERLLDTILIGVLDHTFLVGVWFYIFVQGAHCKLRAIHQGVVLMPTNNRLCARILLRYLYLWSCQALRILSTSFLFLLHLRVQRLPLSKNLHEFLVYLIAI